MERRKPYKKMSLRDIRIKIKEKQEKKKESKGPFSALFT